MALTDYSYRGLGWEDSDDFPAKHGNYDVKSKPGKKKLGVVPETAADEPEVVEGETDSVGKDVDGVIDWDNLDQYLEVSN
jgi:hypothetical protein